MKKTFLLFVLLNVSLAVRAQSADYLWPVMDVQAGKGIVSAPQGLIGKELNSEYLFITAPEGTVIVSPADGVVKRVYAGYLTSLVTSFSDAYTGDFDKSIKNIQAGLDKKNSPKYVYGAITITADDGRNIDIRGLSGNESFKTGQKVKKGEPIGRMSYSYYKIKQPSIIVAVSDPEGGSRDPMTPFGLKTTYIPPGEAKPVLSLSKEQAKEDFLIYINALKELYPSLYNVVSEEELNKHVGRVEAQIDSFSNDLAFADFWDIMRVSCVKIHDSHICMFYPQWSSGQKTEDAFYWPQISFGWINDTLIVTRATKKYEDLIGRRITSINAIEADSVKNIVLSYIDGYDGQSKGYPEYLLATTGFGYFLNPPYVEPDYSLLIKLADGEQINVEGTAERMRLFGNWGKFSLINMHKGGYTLEMLNDSTAYIGLYSFTLNDVAVEDIARFIDSIANVGNLIIDVRNNPGGDGQTTLKLYSYIAGDTMMLNGYSRVNKKGAFESLKYTLNYGGMPDMEIYPDYAAEQGKEGYYLRSENLVTADPNVNYKGRVYVLTNGVSSSAATLFPALVIRNHRGVTVGRETRGAYHFMNALDYADIRLPHSTITVRIPMVEIVFDTIVNERVPYGRGVIPDYNIPFSLDELTFENGDAILNYALKLIEEGKYFKGADPFAAAETQNEVNSGSKLRLALAILGGILLVVVITGILFKKRTRTLKQSKRQ